jgi:hypothetical protein
MFSFARAVLAKDLFPCGTCLRMRKHVVTNAGEVVVSWTRARPREYTCSEKTGTAEKA